MPLPASFSVGPQHAQPDENTGYNTQPAFVIPGSKAAERNARHKKGSIPDSTNSKMHGEFICLAFLQSLERRHDDGNLFLRRVVEQGTESDW